MWGFIGWWLLWKTYYPRNWARPRIPWLYDRNKAAGTDLPGTNTGVTSSLTILSFTPFGSSQRLPVALSHCHQGSFSIPTGPARFVAINSIIRTSWLSQWGTSVHLQPTFDSASELEYCRPKTCFCSFFQGCSFHCGSGVVLPSCF